MRCAAIAALSLAAACSGSKPSASSSAVQVQRTEVRGSEEATAPAPVVSHAARGRVLAEVQFRDHVLVIRSGSGERRFDVHARGGDGDALSWSAELRADTRGRACAAGVPAGPGADGYVIVKIEPSRPGASMRPVEAHLARGPSGQLRVIGLRRW